MKDFCDLEDLTISQIEDLVHQADLLEAQQSVDVLSGKVLALLFLNPSLRTLTSFQATMIRLGGGTFVVSPEMSIHRLESKSGIVMDGVAAEHLNEAVPVIASYADAIGIRATAKRNSIEEDLMDDEFRQMRCLCDVPVINLESSIRHPCQSLADWKTLDDYSIPRRDGKLVISWVYHPDALSLSIPGDTLHMAAARGMNVVVLRPDGFELPREIVDRAQRAADVTGASICETNDTNRAMENAQVVYASSWSSTQFYGDYKKEQQLRNQHRNWCLSESHFKVASESCYFMHALPVRRGVEVEDEVLDSSRSIVVRQAKNRMLTQMAILKTMLGKV